MDSLQYCRLPFRFVVPSSLVFQLIREVDTLCFVVLFHRHKFHCNRSNRSMNPSLNIIFGTQKITSASHKVPIQNQRLFIIKYIAIKLSNSPISRRMARASATETVNVVSISDQAKPKTVTTSIYRLIAFFREAQQRKG